MSSQSPQFEQQAVTTSTVIWDLMQKLAHSCLNCTNFNRETETCNLVNQRPPIEVVVKGCEAWDQAIPF